MPLSVTLNWTVATPLCSTPFISVETNASLGDGGSVRDKPTGLVVGDLEGTLLLSL